MERIRQRNDLGIMAIDENDGKWFWGTFRSIVQGHRVDMPDISQKNLGVTDL